MRALTGIRLLSLVIQIEKPSLARKHPIGTKNFRVDAKRLDPSQHGLLPFLFDYLHRNLVDNTRIANRYFKASCRLRAAESSGSRWPTTRPALARQKLPPLLAVDAKDR